MAVTPLPEFIWPLLAKAVLKAKKYVAKDLVKIVEDAIPKQKRRGAITETKVEGATVNGLIMAYRKKERDVGSKEMAERMRTLGMDNITITMIDHKISRMRERKVLPASDVEKVREKKQKVSSVLRNFVNVNLQEGTIRSKDLAQYTLLLTRRTRRWLKDDTIVISEDDVREAFDELYWDVAKENEIKSIIRKGLPDTFFLQLHMHGHITVPEWVLRDKWMAIKGRTPSQHSDLESNPGIWNVKAAFMSSGTYTIPRSSPTNPVELDEGHDGPHQLATFIAPHFGSAYDPDIVQNFLRMAAVDAKRRKVNDILLAGRLFYIDTVAAGGVCKINRDVYSGATVDVDAFSKIYQQRVEEILAGERTDELIYMTAEERLEHLLSGIWGVLTQPNLEPEFDGNFLVVLGPDVERLAHVIVAAKQRYETRKDLPKWKDELAVAKTRLKREQEDLLNHPDSEGALQAIDALKQIRDKYQDMVNRVVLANIIPAHAKQDVPKVLAWMAQRIEKSIPNCRVIGLGTTFVKWKRTGATMEVYVDDTKRPYDTFMESHGLLDREHGMSDVVITVNSMGQYSTTLAVESVWDNSRKSVLVSEPPVMLDKEAVRAVPTSRKAMDAVLNFAKKKDFATGYQVFVFHKPVGDEQSRFPPVWYTVLAKHIQYAAKQFDKNGKMDVYEPRHMSGLNATDVHTSSINSFFSRTSTGEIFNTLEGNLHLVLKWCMRKGRAPFHMFSVPDDAGQYANFPGYTNLHPERETVEEIAEGNQDFLKQIQKECRKRKFDKSRILALAKENVLWTTFQLLLRGEHTITEQLESISCVFRRYMEVTKGILLAASDAKVSILSPGVTKPERRWRTKNRKERRAMGLFSFGVSNHFTRSLDKLRPGLIFDSEIIRRSLVNFFRKDPELEKAGYSEEDLEKVITAPRTEAESVGFGVVCVDGKEVCPIEMRPSPIKRGPWHDPLRMWPKIDAQRADPAGFFIRDRTYRYVLTGDKHMAQVIVTAVALYEMGAPGTLPDSFADIAGGIRPNSSGEMVTCVPEIGISNGPTQILLIPGYVIAYFLDHPKEKYPLLEMLPKLL